MPPSFDPSILVVSLGNPAPLHNTLHSAGHHALAALRAALDAGARPRPDRYTLRPSPTSMNVSGPFVSRTWRVHLADCQRERRPAGLVVLHDEMERKLGTVAMREWSRSRKGHNGLRSIDGSLRYDEFRGRGAGARWATIGVGIGRPESRERQDVSDYVLGWMRREQLEALAGTGRPILDLLARFESEWEREAASSA